MNLNSLRNKINKIDSRLILLLAKRQSLAHFVGIEKKKHNIKINQPKREKEVLLELEQISKKAGLSIELTRKIYREIFKNSKDIQKRSGKL